MPSGRKTTTKKPLPRSKRSRKNQSKRRHGPLMRFKFGKLILIWILSLIICFGTYLYNRNVHPEKDVFVRAANAGDPADATETETTETTTVTTTTTALPLDQFAFNETTLAETTALPEETGLPGELTDTTDVTGTDTPTMPVPTVVNPVPESAPQDSSYLAKCAFVGETNIYNLKKSGLLNEYNVYASDRLTLTNYTKEYVDLDGTSIRILSALNSADCPIYLMFGTESLTDQPADQTAEQFSVMLNSLIATAPEAKIYILSIPPVTAAAEQGDKPLLNSKIDEYNSLLLQLANEKSIHFIDVNTALKNNDGKLNYEYAMEDGVHLTSEAGQVLLDYVLCHIPLD